MLIREKWSVVVLPDSEYKFPEERGKGGGGFAWDSCPAHVEGGTLPFHEIHKKVLILYSFPSAIGITRGTVSAVPF